MRKKEPLTWIPLYIDKWLYGSTREELEADECSVWIDLLALAGKDDGFIRANEGFPYSEARLAGLLGRPEELVHRTIEKCIKTFTANPDERPKLTRLPDGTLYVTNWAEYQLSDRHARRFSREASAQAAAMAGKADTMAGKPDARVEESRVEKNREEERVAGSAPAGPALKDRIPEIFKLWNDYAKCAGLPGLRSIDKGSSRERVLLARIREGISFEKILEAIDAQPFLRGDNERGWLVTFDWILKPANLAKLLEGAYVKDRRGDAARRAPDDPRTGAASNFKKR